MKKSYFFIAMLLYSAGVWAQTTGDYRSAATGNWNVVATWERYDGASWVAAVLVPSNADGVITIRSPHVVTITAVASYDQLTVDAGAQVTVAPTVATSMANGTGTDLTINGTWLHSGGTWTVTGTTWSVGAGGTYIHNTTASAATPLGLATLDPASTVIYRGSSTLVPAVSYSGRTYGNLSFESTSGSWTPPALSGSSASSCTNYTIGSGVTLTITYTGVFTINGNFIQNGTLTNSTGTQIYTFTGSGKTISGSGAISFETFNVNSGASITANNNVTIPSTFTATVTGSFATAATFTNSGTMNVNGTFKLNDGGSLSGTSPVYGASSTLVYAGTSTQTPTASEFPSANGPNNLIIDNSTGVTFPGSFVRTIAGDLNLSSGILNDGGNTITVAGNITGTGTHAGAGKIAMTGSAKTISGATLRNIEFNNAGGFVLSGSPVINGDLALTNGTLALGANNLTLAGTISDGSSTSYIKTNGAGTVTVNNITTEVLVPLGNTKYNPVLIENSSGHNWAVRVEDGVTADPGLNTDKAVLLTWHITPSVNPPAAPANITFQFDETTQVGPLFVVAENVQAWHRISHWNPQGVPAAVVGLSGAKKAKVLGLTNFSPYALSNPLGPLPITIDYFNGTKQGTTHNLVWKVTCQSTPSATLILERSTDGRNYKEIYSIVATALRCQQPFDYTSTQPEAGINYYRLKMLDANGKVSYSSIVALLNKQSGFDIIGLAPNPVTANAVLNVTAAEAGTLQIAVTDMNGRKVMTQTETLQAGSKQVIMNLSKLPTGTYQVSAFYSDGTKKTIRLVKQ